MRAWFSRESLARLRWTLWIPWYLFCFALLEDTPGRGYWLTELPADSRIPFCSLFLIPYCLWYVLLIAVGVWLYIRRKDVFRRYMLFLSATSLASVALWLCFPNGQELRPAAPDGILGWAVARLYALDTNTNVFPSLHVVGALGAAAAVWDGLYLRCGETARLFAAGGRCQRDEYAAARAASSGVRRRNRRICLAVTALAVLICASTVFLKQHSLLDVLDGVLFSAAAGIPIYRAPAEPARIRAGRRFPARPARFRARRRRAAA